MKGNRKSEAKRIVRIIVHQNFKNNWEITPENSTFIKNSYKFQSNMDVIEKSKSSLKGC